MRINSLASLTLIFLFLFSAFKPVQASELGDEFSRSVFQYLAERRNMNLLAYSGEAVAEIGRIYYIEEPSSPRALERWADSGRELSLFQYDSSYDLSDYAELQREESYQIQERYANYILGNLQAELLERGIDLEAFKSALKNAQIRFVVYRKTMDARQVSSMLMPQKDKIISEYKEFNLGKGIIVPFQQLIISDFSYNSAGAQSLKALLDFDLLENIQSKLSAQTVNENNSRMDLPDSATIAFKPYPLYFRESNFFGWFD